jgi:hypothetical protein
MFRQTDTNAVYAGSAFDQKLTRPIAVHIDANPFQDFQATQVDPFAFGTAQAGVMRPRPPRPVCLYHHPYLACDY